MSKKSVLFSLVATLALSTIIGIKSADAKAKVVGKYQEGMGKAIITGGTVGYKAAGVPGAVVGGAAGAGYYDHQHNSNKVHNYRTPRVNWTRFQFGNGEFVRQGQWWVEYQGGRPAFYFSEVNRSPNFIDLYDQSRQITVRIENGHALILRPGQNWQHLYQGRNY